MSDPNIGTAAKAEIEAVANAAIEALGEVSSGLADSLKSYAVAIASDIVRARASGNQDLAAEVAAQALALAEVHKVKLKKHANVVVNAFVRGAFTVASAALGGIPGAVAGMIGGAR